MAGRSRLPRRTVSAEIVVAGLFAAFWMVQTVEQYSAPVLAVAD